MRKNMKKHAKLVAAVTLAASLIGSSSVFALNTAGGANSTGNKPWSFIGYEVQDSTHVALYFNKKTTNGVRDIIQQQFEVKPNGGGSNLVSGISISAGTGSAYSGTTDTGTTQGTKVVLTLSSSLTGNGLYDVTIDDTVMSDNGITIGNYYNRSDRTFTFQAPSGGSYNSTNAPIITYFVGEGTNDVSRESDVTVIFSRPVNLSDPDNANFKSDMNANFTNDTALQQVPGNESHNVVSNDVNSINNTFYFPMTQNGSGTTVYNRDAASDYTLDIPQYDDLNGTPRDPAPYTFSTMPDDVPGWLNNASTAGGTNAAPTVTLSGTTLTVGWYDTWVDNTPDKYYVYYLDVTANPSKNEYTPLTDGAWSVTSITGSTPGTWQTVTPTVTAGHTYKVRIVPAKTYSGTEYKVGVSKAGSN